MTRVCIVLPTYNEAQNVKRTLDVIFRKTQVMRPRVQTSVLVVDDSSPDGTAHIVEEYRESNADVHLLLRKEKNGLGAAYIAGMTYALKKLRPDIVFEMDADLSHDPGRIPVMVQKILSGADMCIGSRYVDGGSIPSHWGWKRVFMSKCANGYARFVLGLPVKDCTGGFRAFRSEVLRAIDLKNLSVDGYAFQVVLLYHVAKSGFVIEEIPIDFQDREFGSSKLRVKDMTELLVRIPSLLLRRIPAEQVS